MPETAWRKGSPLALLVGMWIVTATKENNMEFPLKKIWIRDLPYDTVTPLVGIYPEKITVQEFKPMMIHANVWQKTEQYCKTIILQLKINKFNN